MKKIILGIGIVVGIAFGFWILTEEDKPPESSKEDTGMDRSETENLMREIGYVQ